jgi:hypothetical protein
VILSLRRPPDAPEEVPTGVLPFSARRDDAADRDDQPS